LPQVPTANRTPWWEQRQTPWWERQGPPAWEQQQVPAWQTKNAARTLLNEERDRRRLEQTPRRRYAPPPVYYVLPPYRYFPNNTLYSYGVSSSTVFMTPPAPNTVYTEPPPVAEPPITTGFLKLEVEPRHLLQVFVDGLYIGTLADLGEELELRLGARRIELRAPGYRTLIFDTEIVVDRTIVYRGALEVIPNARPSEPSPAPPAPPEVNVKPSATPGSRTMFLIPGCYMGNVAPVQANLRAGCDLKNLQKIEP